MNGAATADRLYPAERFARGASAVHVLEATDDGSRGHRGRVTDLVRGAVRPDTTAVFACGPNVMLAALARVLEALPPPAARLDEASIEAPMGCGFGTCLGCALPVRGEAWRAGVGALLHGRPRDGAA